MPMTSKLRALKARSRSRKPKDAEWRRLAEMPEIARSSKARPYWVCSRFLCAMHSLATCSGLVKEAREREGGVWCNAVVGLGLKACEKRGPRHLEVFNVAYEYSEFGEVFDAGLLVGLRDELVIEERDRWDMLTEREQDVLWQVDSAGEGGLQSGQIAKDLRTRSGFAKGRPTGVGKKLLADLCGFGVDRDHLIEAPLAVVNGEATHLASLAEHRHIDRIRIIGQQERDGLVGLQSAPGGEAFELVRRLHEAACEVSVDHLGGKVAGRGAQARRVCSVVARARSSGPSAP